MKLEPLEDYVVIEPLEPEKVTPGGIHLPDSATQTPSRGRVLAVGPGRSDSDSGTIPVAVRKGDEVIHTRYGGHEIELEGKKVRIMRESEVLARVT